MSRAIIVQIKGISFKSMYVLLLTCSLAGKSSALLLINVIVHISGGAHRARQLYRSAFVQKVTGSSPDLCAIPFIITIQ